MIHTITPSTTAEWLTFRAKNVNSTESSALFGVCPYTTEFELYHRLKDGRVVEIEPTARMKWGTRLQNSIAAGIAEDQGWEIRPMPEYMWDDDLRMGSSFDFAIGDDGLLEVKNVDALAFRDGWLVDGDDVEAPAHIEIQVQHQLALTGRKYAYIGALVGGNNVVLIRREPDEKVIYEIKKRIASLWFAIASDQEPKPDFSRDAEFIARLYQYAEPGKVLRLESDEEITTLAQRYREFGKTKAEAEEALDAIKAQLLMRIGDAEKVLGDGFTISAGVVGPARVEYDRKAYRTFRLNWKKEKRA